jgi:hypothetical protein
LKKRVIRLADIFFSLHPNRFPTYSDSIGNDTDEYKRLFYSHVNSFPVNFLEGEGESAICDNASATIANVIAANVRLRCAKNPSGSE